MNRPLRIAAGIVGVGAAFALGCVPSAELVARLYGRGPIVALGNGNPGAANVRRTLGMPAALLVGALDVSKGWLPTRMAKKLGAPDSIAGPMAMAPVAAHILVVGGKGAAAAVGAASAFDPLAMVIAGAGLSGEHQATARTRGHGGRLRLSHDTMVIRTSARARALELRHHCALGGWAPQGPRRGAKSLSGRVLWERLWFDREPVD